MEAQFLEFSKGFDFSFLKRVKKILIIHGHEDNDLMHLQKILYDLGTKPIILKETIEFEAITLAEKLEKEAKRCEYAVALCTPDDMINKDGKKYFQVRPNVLYEIGWFCGKFGRDKILILKKEGTEVFSDFHGVIHVPYKEKLDETLAPLFFAFKRSKII